MANPLTGAFAQPAPQQSTMQKIGERLQAFGAGYRGAGDEFLNNRQARQERLSQERTGAMIADAMKVHDLLNNNRFDDAISLIDNRVESISKLGGDPVDTLRVRELITSGNVPAAKQEIESLIRDPRAQAYLKQTTGQGQDPSSVREYQYFNSLSPEQQQQYLTMKRANPAINLGDRSIIADPTNPSGAPLAEFQQGISPEALPETRGAQTAAVQSAEIAAIPERAEAEREAELISGQGKRAGALASRGEQTQLLTDLVDQAKDQSGLWTTGFIGSALSKVPQTPAYDLARTLDTLQASAGFDSLQQMRDNSPTGGALGQVTERELALLQSTWSSVVQAQSQAQFEKNLERFQKQVDNSWNRVASAYERDYGEPYFRDEDSPSASGQNDDPLGIR